MNPVKFVVQRENESLYNSELIFPYVFIITYAAVAKRKKSI